MSKNKKIVIGIMSEEKIRARMLAIAKGEYHPKKNEPGVWFTSIRSLAEVLSENNRDLLNVISEMKPESLQDLAEATGRQPSNLSRTLRKLESYGFVELRKQNRTVRPIVKATEFEIHAA